MIIKEKDSPAEAIQVLEEILQRSDLPEGVRRRVEQELRMVQAGHRGERDAAYYIDFHFGDHNENWAVIHDLRLEYDGRVAQIDHLLIGRFLEFYVLESKSFAYGVKITEDGEFLVWRGNRYKAVPSPIEQNRRHIAVLKSLLEGEGLLPKRAGLRLNPIFRSYVLVSPKSRVIRPDRRLFDTRMVIKADLLYERVKEDGEKAGLLEKVGLVAREISVEELRTLAQRVVAYHQPIVVDYYARFGLSPRETRRRVEERRRYYCFKCGRPISKRVAVFCFQHKERFGGRAYCMACQREFQG